jgi:hypothetical protein
MRLAGEHSRRAATGHTIGDFLKAAFWHDRWKRDQIGPSFDVETLWSCGWIDAPPRFRARGLERRKNDAVMGLDRGGRA